MKKVNINDIRIDGGTQGRVVIDQQTVAKYVESMKEGDEFPKMLTVYDGSTHWLVDGFHRYHAMKIIGIKQVEIEYKPGTLEEAQLMSFGMNARHGLPRSNEDKRKIVTAAIEHPLLIGKSNYEIAKVCGVSNHFVASIKDPKVKEKQAKARDKSSAKKTTSGKTPMDPIHSGKPLEKTSEAKLAKLEAGAVPDDEEIKANEMAMQADMKVMYELLESDDKLADAYAEIKRLNLLNSQLEVRMNALIAEKGEAIKMVKSLQKQLDKIRKQK